MARYSEGDWVTYRHHEGWSARGKILEIRPDNKVVIGQHDNDPKPDIINKGEVIEKV